MTKLGSEGSPLGFIGERLNLSPRTDDPADLRAGTAWIRGDIDNDGDWLAAFRYYDGNETVDIPVLDDDKDVDEEVSKSLRVQVGDETGFLGIAPRAKATAPELSIQHNGEVYGLTNVALAIPDKVDYRWEVTEGSGQTLSPSIGDVDITLDFDRWVSGDQYNGGVAIDTDEGDSMVTDDPVPFNGEQATFAMWIEDITYHDQYNIFFGAGVDGPDVGNPDEGWKVGMQSPSEVEARHYVDGSSTQLFPSEDVGDMTDGQHFMVVYVVDGNEGTLYIYEDDGTQFAKESDTGSRGITDEEHITFLASLDDYLSGYIDDIWGASSDALSEDEIEDVLEITGPNA